MNYLNRQNNYWNPVTEFRREMDTLFEDFFIPIPRSKHELDTIWKPAYEVTEEASHYLLSLEMPGIPKDDIKIEIADNTVTVSGERHAESKKNENATWYGERRYGKFQRSFTLPAGIDSEKIEADYRDGILQLLVPKAESAKPRQIKIGSSTSFFEKLLGDSKKRDEVFASAEKERIA